MGIKFGVEFGSSSPEAKKGPSPKQAHDAWKERMFEIGIGGLAVGLDKSGFYIAFGNGRAPKEIPDASKVDTGGWSFGFDFEFGKRKGSK